MNGFGAFPGLGTIVNTLCIVVGGLIGRLCGSRLKQDTQQALTKVCGVSVMFIGIAGAMEGMLSVEDGALASGKTMLTVISLALGALIGELLGIERGFERFGLWLRRKTGSDSDAGFVNAFVTASLTVCIGAMAIVGSIKDALECDPSILFTKGILDLIIICVMTCSLGKGSAYSAIPVFALQGAMTALAVLIKPIMTEGALASVSLVGSILIFCVGVNLLFGKQIRVANLLPALLAAAAAAFI